MASHRVKAKHFTEALHFNGFYLTDEQKKKLPKRIADAFLKQKALAVKLEEIPKDNGGEAEPKQPEAN